MLRKRMAVLFLAPLTAALFTPPAKAATTLSDSQEPGSVLVFPLFETGVVSVCACPLS